jgi:Arc/MetJ-type ribon-helix-helix transcriptional regulator
MSSKAVPTKFPEKMLEELNEAVDEGYYANRSELVRDAVRERLRKLRSERLEDAIKEDVEWGLQSEK